MAILDKDKYFWTTSYRTTQIFYWFGFSYTKDKSDKGRDLYVFEKTDELMEVFSFYQTMRMKLKEINQIQF